MTVFSIDLSLRRREELVLPLASYKFLWGFGWSQLAPFRHVRDAFA